MNTPQLVCGATALTLVLTGCQRPAAQADAEKIASDVKGGAQTAAAKAGERLADSWLTTKIQSKFVADPDIKATDISVSSDGGVVTLKGRVLNEPMRALAVAIANNTDGVSQVVDRLTVTVAGPTTITRAGSSSTGAVATSGAAAANPATSSLDDARITSSIRAKYFLDDRIKGRHIDVDTANAVVTLRGEVGDQAERGDALLLARTTEGVKRVEDSLAITAGDSSTGAAAYPGADTTTQQPSVQKSVQKDDDAALVNQIQSNLGADREMRGAHITVTANKGVIVLGGTAPSAAEKQRALTLVRGTDGVMQIVDRIRVGKATK